MQVEIQPYYFGEQFGLVSLPILFIAESHGIHGLRGWSGGTCCNGQSDNRTKRTPLLRNFGTAAMTPFAVPLSGWFMCRITTVSYTHLTLPTKRIVQITAGGGA
eukprot:TRINITY_DN45688_c0_g1_i1.p2 TRINITY_DN45688_c0_g1~~TRINITY_DN45688_c0_g1_i1.p2  ORF type:complete len:104 (+),score=7.88 TRINITY_DN45688_c0_g1_i1:15-326(+)